MADIVKNGMNRSLSNRAFRVVYKKFKNSSGLMKTACAEVMVEKLSKVSIFIEEDVIPDFLNELDLDPLWTLATRCKNEHVKELAKDKIVEILLDDDLMNQMLEKSRADDAYLKQLKHQ